MMSRPPSGRAIVIGGSMTGLLTARVLADHFHEVLVLERDPLGDTSEFRRGVPQGRQIHFTLASFRTAVARMFPGIMTDFETLGALTVDFGSDVLNRKDDLVAPRNRIGLEGICCTRTALEQVVRRRALGWPGVSVVTEREVTGLIADPTNERILGVRHRSVGGSASVELYGDLVVDASGHGSRAPRWLSELGYPPPVETIVDAKAGYATRYYRRPAEFRPDWKYLVIMLRPPDHSRALDVQLVEDDRVVVQLFGVGGDYPSTDEAGFAAFARSLPAPECHQIVEHAEPLGPVFPFRRLGNRLRKYDSMERWPRDFVVLGDAVARLNPIYGQGMAVGALGAAALGRWLSRLRWFGRHPPQFAELFQKRVMPRTYALAWQMSVAADLAWPTTVRAAQGESSWSERVVQSYSDALTELIHESPRVYRACNQVSHFVRGPHILMQPGVAYQVLKYKLGRRGSKVQRGSG